MDNNFTFELDSDKVVVLYWIINKAIEECFEMFQDGDRSDDLRATGATLLSLLETFSNSMLESKEFEEYHEVIGSNAWLD